MPDELPQPDRRTVISIPTEAVTTGVKWLFSRNIPEIFSLVLMTVLIWNFLFLEPERRATEQAAAAVARAAEQTVLAAALKAEQDRTAERWKENRDGRKADAQAAHGTFITALSSLAAQHEAATKRVTDSFDKVHTHDIELNRKLLEKVGVKVESTP